ncbi:MAG: site-2 protease family protein [Desertimonas sp.]
MSEQRGAGFRVLGFPVHVRSGFVIFMILIAVLHSNEYGLWLAGSLAAFTLIHELGHALAARRAGATAEISLEFMAGFASYQPTRPISLPMRAWIALAGPFSHIAAGAIVLAAMGHEPFSVPGRDAVAAQAIWWAGPMIGVFNLIPVLPLDGGNVVTTLLERVMPATRARRVMLYVSLTATIGAAIAASMSERTRTLTVFIGFLVLLQLQSLFAERAEHAVSPIDKARAALVDGNEARARSILTAAMRRPAVTAAPQPMTAHEARQLAAVLPRPLPTGHPHQEYVLAGLLLAARHDEEAAHYAAESYGRDQQPAMATMVARAAAAMGDQTTALAWLRTAAEHGDAGRRIVARTLTSAPELVALRHHPDLAATLGS